MVLPLRHPNDPHPTGPRRRLSPLRGPLRVDAAGPRVPTRVLSDTFRSLDLFNCQSVPSPGRTDGGPHHPPAPTPLLRPRTLPPPVPRLDLRGAPWTRAPPKEFRAENTVSNVDAEAGRVTNTAGVFPPPGARRDRASGGGTGPTPTSSLVLRCLRNSLGPHLPTAPAHPAPPVPESTSRRGRASPARAVRRGRTGRRGPRGPGRAH